MPREGRKFDRRAIFIAFRYKDMARRVLGLNVKDQIIKFILSHLLKFTHFYLPYLS